MIATLLAIGDWGYFLYQGIIYPLGGINILWPLFSVANQILAGMAPILATVVLIKMKKLLHVWVTALSIIFPLMIILVAVLYKIFSLDPKIKFLIHALCFLRLCLKVGRWLARSKDMGQMQHIISNDYVNMVLTVLFMAVVL